MAIWVALVAAFTGGFLSIAGLWVNNYLQVREARRTRSEQFAREDRLRDLDHRRKIYAQYTQLLRALYDATYAAYDAGLFMDAANFEHGKESPQATRATDTFMAASRVEVERFEAVSEFLCEIELSASSHVVTHARAIVDAYMNWGRADEPQALFEARQNFVRAARIDLGLPDVGRIPI